MQKQFLLRKCTSAKTMQKQTPIGCGEFNLVATARLCRVSHKMRITTEDGDLWFTVVLRFRGSVVPWFCGSVVPWCRGSVVPWVRGSVVPWFRGSVPWFRGFAVPWFRGSVVYIHTYMLYIQTEGKNRKTQKHKEKENSAPIAS